MVEIVGCRPVHCLWLSFQLFVSIPMSFGIYFIVTEDVVKILQQGWNLRYSFKDIIAAHDNVVSLGVK